MLTMIGKRLMFAIPSLIGVVIVTFLLTRALPGDPAAYFAGPAASKEAIEHVVVLETVGLAMQSAIEHVYSADGTARGAAAATNVFMRTPSGWRIVCHHASPVTAVVMPPPSGPLH